MHRTSRPKYHWMLFRRCVIRRRRKRLIDSSYSLIAYFISPNVVKYTIALPIYIHWQVFVFIMSHWYFFGHITVWFQHVLQCRHNRPIPQIPQCNCSISHNTPPRREMCTFLSWMLHCGNGTVTLWDLWIRRIPEPESSAGRAIWETVLTYDT